MVNNRPILNMISTRVVVCPFYGFLIIRCFVRRGVKKTLVVSVEWIVVIGFCRKTIHMVRILTCPMIINVGTSKYERKKYLKRNNLIFYNFGFFFLEINSQNNGRKCVGIARKGIVICSRRVHYFPEFSNSSRVPKRLFKNGFTSPVIVSAGHKEDVKLDGLSGRTSDFAEHRNQSCN